MSPNIRLSLYAVTALAGLICLFISLCNLSVKFKVVCWKFWHRNCNSFIAGPWATPTSGFVASDTAELLIGILLFMPQRGKDFK